MTFPRKALLTGAGLTMLMFVFGVPVAVSLAFGLISFLVTGGLKYTKLVVQTLPRDLWLASQMLIILRTMKENKKNRLCIHDHFKKTVIRHPEKIAIMFEDRTLTFRELDELSNRIANVLRSIGLCHGESVAIFMENCPEYVAVFLALCKLGVTAALINYNLRKQALAHCIKIGNCSAIIVSPSLSEHLVEVISDLNSTITDRCFSYGQQDALPEARNVEEEVRVASSTDPPPVDNKEATDKACYIYTSGTTGLPKACNIRHLRYYSLQQGVNLTAGIKPDDIVYCTLPLYHTSGGLLSTGQMLCTGATLVLRKKFSASNYWLDCIKYKCTVAFYIGEVCRYVLAQPSRPTDTQHCVRMCVGNGLRPQIWAAFTKRFGIPKIAEFYGSTEGNVGLMNSFNKVGACGAISVVLSRFNPVILVKVDPETGEYVRDSNGFCVKAGVNEPGEVVGAIRQRVATSSFDGYTDSKASSKKVMTDVFRKGDCYFLSGDILRMDEEGFLYFCDRTGDTFRWKGENVSTTEVEASITNILNLTDAVVYGVEVPGCDGRAGMVAIAGTRSSIDLDNLAKKLYLALPSYAVPLFVRLLPAVELTGTFKLKKVQLRNEGFDIKKVSDPIFVMDNTQKCYVPLSPDTYQQIISGTTRL